MHFGEWEKAYRLEKLKESNPIEVDGKIILNGEDISEKIKILRDEKNTKELQKIAKEVGRTIIGTYTNRDTKEPIHLLNSSIDEIKHTHILDKNHVEAIKYIPQIIENSIYITSKPNEDKRKPFIKQFAYHVSGIKINGDDYTVKSVIGIDNQGHRYYDQNLSEIEKGLLVQKIRDQLISPGEILTENLSKHHDKRLLEICQCPQALFLDKNFQPTKDVISAVRSGKTIDDLLHDKKLDFVNSLSANTKDLNQKFNDELQLFIDGKLSENHIFNFGKPNAILVNCDFPKDDNIELRASQLQLKADTHEYDLDIVKNLPDALQNPIAVFKYGEENKKRNVIIEIQKEDRNFLVGVHFDQKRHNTIVSDIRGLFDKDTEKWLNWIEQGKLLYVNEKKIQTVIDQQRTNLAEVEYLNLESKERILSKHQNVNSLSVKKELMFELCTIPEKLCIAKDIKANTVHEQLRNLNHEYIKECVFFPPIFFVHQ